MGSFSLVTCETQDTMMPHQSQDQIYMRAASSSQQAPPVDPAQDRCCCGLKLIKYTCRKQGVDYIEAILPVPERTLSTQQCNFFQWIQETKWVRSTRAQRSKPQPNMPKKSVIPYTSTNCPHAKSQRRSISAQLKEKCEAATRDRILHNDHMKNANISGRTGAAMPTSR